MLQRFRDFLEKTCRCRADQYFLVAVSGGIDSVCLLDLFCESGIRCEAVHCNFRLRGSESDEDQRFVEELSVRYRVPCHVMHFDTEAYARSRGCSIQVAARELRYEYFDKLAGERGFDHVAVAHNLDDQTETFFMNLGRGTGIRGLSGIRPVNGRIVRPLLFASRKDIEVYASLRHLSWREDSSNRESKYTRNAIRHKLIPVFKRIKAGNLQGMVTTMHHLSQTEELFNCCIGLIRDDVTETLKDRVLVDISRLMRYPATETLLYELLRPFGCNRSMALSLLKSLEGEPGKHVLTPTHTITRDRRHLIVTGSSHSQDEECIITDRTLLVTSPLHLKLSLIENEGTNPLNIPKERSKAALDFGLLRFPLKVRHWKPGDAFSPLGMKGTKKISDFLIDRKVPLPDKDRVFVIETEGNVVWLVNHRIDNRYRVTPETRQVLLIEYLDEPDPEDDTGYT